MSFDAGFDGLPGIERSGDHRREACGESRRSSPEFDQIFAEQLRNFVGRGDGQLKSLCDHCLIAPSDNMQHVEELHLVVLHAIYSAIRDTYMSLPG